MVTVLNKISDVKDLETLSRGICLTRVFITSFLSEKLSIFELKLLFNSNPICLIKKMILFNSSVISFLSTPTYHGPSRHV